MPRSGGASPAASSMPPRCSRRTEAGANARAWVLTIVRHAAYTWLGKNRPAALVMTDDLEAAERNRSDGACDAPQSPEAALIAKTDAARLETAIAELPVPFRETLVLR